MTPSKAYEIEYLQKQNIEWSHTISLESEVADIGIEIEEQGRRNVACACPPEQDSQLILPIVDTKR